MKGITKGEWKFKRWDGEQWPEKRWSVGTEKTAICISPKYFTEGEESEANGKLISIAGNLTNAGYNIEAMPQLVEALEEAKLQIEYLHQKFSETGSGNAVLTKIEEALKSAKL